MKIAITNNHIEEEINIPVGKIKLQGDLIIPEMATSLILFSHGSGSNRFSSRNNILRMSKIRIIFIPPPVDPAHPPKNIIKMIMNLKTSGH